MSMIDLIVSGTERYHNSRQSRLRVGTDILPMKESYKQVVNDEIFAPGSAESTIDSNTSNYSNARTLANFGEVQYRTRMGTVSLNKMEMGSDQPRTGVFTYMHKGEEKNLIFNASTDVRITFNKDGEAVILSGNDALTDGVLKATGQEDILLRFSADKVEGGDSSCTIINLAESAATYAGGKGGITFMGSFANSIITGGLNANQFKGIFTKCEISGGSKDDEFSGFFAESTINAGDGDDKFTGMFIKNSKIFGEDGDDSFTGQFSEAELFGGIGSNFYGMKAGPDSGDVTVKDQGDAKDKKKNIDIGSMHGSGESKNSGHAEISDSTNSAGDGKEDRKGTDTAGGPAKQKNETSADTGNTLADDSSSSIPEHIQALSQFVNVKINDEGDNTRITGVFTDSKIKLSKGKSNFNGVLYDSEIDAGESKQTNINVAFANQSKILGGNGEDQISIVTGKNNRVSGGEGKDTINMGNIGDSLSTTFELGAKVWDLTQTDYYLPGQLQANSNSSPIEFGTLQHNVIDAADEQDKVTVATGDSKSTLDLGANHSNEVERQREPAETDADYEKRMAELSERQKADGSKISTMADLPGYRHDSENDAVQVLISGTERISYGQSYEARKGTPDKVISTFSSINPLSWSARQNK